MAEQAGFAYGLVGNPEDRFSRGPSGLFQVWLPYIK